MRDKLQDREFEFNEAAWLEAEKMIEDQEGRKRRGGFWWWIPMLFVAIIAGTLFYTFAYTNDSSKNLTDNAIQSTEISSTTASGQNETTENNSSASNSTNTNSLDQDPNNSNQEIENSEQEMNSSEKSVAQNSNSNNSNSNQQKANSFQSNNESSIVGGNLKNSTSEIKAVPQNLGSVATNQISTNENNDSNSVNSTGSSSSNSEETISSNPTIGITNTPSDGLPTRSETAATSESATAPISASNNPSTIKTAEVLNEESIKSTALINLLDNKDIFATAEDRKMKECDSFSDKHRFWFPGIAIESNFYPSSQIVGDSSNQALWIGGAVGMTNRFRVSNNISIGLDLLYHIYKPTFNSTSGQSMETNYSFGKTTTFFENKTNSEHYLSIPIYLQFQNRKQIIEAGAIYDRRFQKIGQVSSRRTLFPFERESPERLTTEPEILNTGVLSADSTSASVRTRLQVLLGYKYQVSPQLHVGLRAKYLLNVPGEDEISINENGSLSFSATVNYYFFRPKKRLIVKPRN